MRTARWPKLRWPGYWAAWNHTSGVIRYNGVDLRHLNLDSVNRFRGFILDSQLSLFEGTLEENIVLGREYIPYSDVRWALRFTELEEVDALPHGLKTHVRAAGKIFAPTHIVRILVARASWERRNPSLIFEGILHNMHPAMRETILRRLCSKEEPWSVIFVSNDPNLTPHVDRRIMLN